MKQRFAWLMLLTLLLAALGAQVAAASVSGAIFTTLPDGTTVNSNIYPAKTDVYLDGGPGPHAPISAAGLPGSDSMDKGWYYFQVTDPSGKVLLSTDAAKWRMFHVNASGVINAVVDGSGKHVTGVDADHAATTVQLMPFLDTPNNGGVYKVWATPKERFLGNPEKVDSGGQFHGFVPAYSKTDNYKVRGQIPQRLTVKKFIDFDGDGTWDPEDMEYTGWPVRVTEPTKVGQDLWTPVELLTEVPGVWNVTESSKPEDCPLDWYQTSLTLDGGKLPVFASVNVKFGRTGGETHDVVFGNVPKHTVRVHKFVDANSNGEDEDEVGQGGVWFTLTGSGAWGTYGPVQKQTDSNGNVEFSGLKPGTYKLAETLPEGWKNTTPLERTFTLGMTKDTFTCDSDAYVHCESFGNVREGKTCVQKFHDVNGNGSKDDGEEFIAGWAFKLTGTNDRGVSISLDGTTGPNGEAYCFEHLWPGDYTLTEVIPEGEDWRPTALYYTLNGPPVFTKDPDTSVSIRLEPGDAYCVTFGNCRPGCIEGIKVWDKDGNGIKDGTDEFYAGWEITLHGRTNLGEDVSETLETDANGSAKFCGLMPGTYWVEEAADTEWFVIGQPKSPEIVLTSGGGESFTFYNCKKVELTVCKFHDRNANGEQNDGDAGISGWSIKLEGPNGFVDTKQTGEEGCVTFTDLWPGSYTVTEIIPENTDWEPTYLAYRVDEGLELTPVKPPTTSLPIDLASGAHGKVKWGNAGKGCVEAKKFYDFDMDGKKGDDSTEPWIEGWKIRLSGGDLAAPIEKSTDANGSVKFEDLKPGHYTVTEIFPKDTAWQATTPTSYEVEVLSHECAGPYLFGNVYAGTADFGTKGWWHNKNGNALIDASDIAYLNSLDPYAAPTEYWETPFADRDEIGDFVVEEVDASPHRFQLAQQLCAFILNVRHYTGGNDAEISLPGKPAQTAQSLIDGAIAAWNAGEVGDCSGWIGTLDAYNNCDAVMMVSHSPGPIEY